MSKELRVAELEFDELGRVIVPPGTEPPADERLALSDEWCAPDEQCTLKQCGCAPETQCGCPPPSPPDSNCDCKPPLDANCDCLPA
jgi:hypothetical protein